MRVVFNTSQPHAAASLFYQQALEGMPGMSFYDTNFAAYDVALFMTYDYTLVEGIKRQFPHLKIGIIDPRKPALLEATPHCDFLVVDGVEMEDFWRAAGKPIFRYVEYPRFSVEESELKKVMDFKSNKTLRDRTYIGYHGNPLHIMEGSLTSAITELGEKYDIELLLMHNNVPPKFDARYKESLPSGVTVTHVPWHMDNYKKFLLLSDIGVVPNSLDAVPASPSTTGDPNTDYCLSFKMTSNPGRFAVFGLLGVPVVADFYPSSLQYLQKGSGMVAHSHAGWKHCLEALIKSPSLRQEMGTSLRNLVKEEFDFGIQNEKFKNFLEKLLGEENE